MGSRSSSSTSSNTTNEFFDQRQVNDAGGGIAGGGNQWDQSVSAIDSGNTTWTDASSQTWIDSSSQTWTDKSNNSQNWTDNSTVNNSSIDPGAFKLGEAQTAAARAIAERAIEVARSSSEASMQAALKAQENAIGSSNAATAAALNFAGSNQTKAFESNQKAIGMVGEKFDTLAGLALDVVKTAGKQSDSAGATAKAAYDSAASQANGNKTLMYVALAAVAIVSVAVMQRGNK
jgi:hypothetical protein